MTWGWCCACQGLFSRHAAANPWSCAAGGRHDPASDGTTARSGDLVPGPVVDPAAPSGVAPTVAPPEPIVAVSGVSSDRRTTIRGAVTHLSPPLDSWQFDGGALTVDDLWGQTSDRRAITCTWWMKATGDQTEGAVVLDHRAGVTTTDPRARATHGFAVALSAGRFVVHVADGSTSRRHVLGRAPAPDRWAFVAVSIGDTVRVVVDGVEVGSEPTGGTALDAGSAPLVIGGHCVPEGPTYRGELADVQVFPRSLDAAEIDAVRRAGDRAGSTDAGWATCDACGLVIDVCGDTPGCRALGGDPHRPGPDRYTVAGTGHHALAGWSRCSRCRALFFAPFVHLSACGAGGRHVSDGTNLSVTMHTPPDLAAVERPDHHIVFVAADRDARASMSVADELRYVTDAITGTPWGVIAVANPSPGELGRLLADVAPDVVHISAHGAPEVVDDLLPGSGGLWFDDEPMTVDELADLLSASTAGALGTRPAAVVVNGPETARVAAALAACADAVIGVEAAVPAEVAVFIGPLLYDRIARGDTIEAALASARSALTERAHVALDHLPRLVARAGAVLTDSVVTDSVLTDERDTP